MNTKSSIGYLRNNLSEIHKLKINSPTFQRKDPITHNGVIPE
jgi:hypothetical protein